MEYTSIKSTADELVKVLAPYCERIEIAGSIRRLKPECKDIEIVAIPRKYFLEEYFIKQKGRYIFSKCGKSYKQFIYRATQIDLFLCSKDNWGLIFLIRTGSDVFSRNVLADWKRVSHGGYSDGGYLHTAVGEKLITPEESDVFKLIEWKFIEPERRSL